VNPAIDLSGGPFEIGLVTPQAITLVDNPKWWGGTPNARQITVRFASSTDQLSQWMSSGYVQVAQPSVVTPSFLTQMTGLPGAQSNVDYSNSLLQLDFASSPGTSLGPDMRVAIALLMNRQDLVDQQVSWAVPQVQVPDSHVSVQGQTTYKPVTTSSTTTIPPSSSSTSTTVIGAGGSVNFPVTPVPQQADTLIEQTGLVRNPGEAYWHYAFGTPYSLTMVVDQGDPWAVAAAQTMKAQLAAGGLDSSLESAASATQAGQMLANGSVDMAVMPQNFTPYMSQTLAWYTNLLGLPGQNGSQNWTGYSSSQFDQKVQTASQELNPDTAATSYAQADTQLWDEMVSLPLLPEPSALVWSSKVGGVMPTPRSDSLLWYAQNWAVKVPESSGKTTPTLPGQQVPQGQQSS